MVEGRGDCEGDGSLSRCPRKRLVVMKIEGRNQNVTGRISGCSPHEGQATSQGIESETAVQNVISNNTKTSSPHLEELSYYEYAINRLIRSAR